MQPHQQRVIDEKSALDANRAKLAAFIEGAVFHTLPEDERRRLIRQSILMQQLSEVLGERIVAFQA